MGLFSGSDFLFMVTFSVEVNDGFLVASLPSELINTTELKIKNSYQWQPLRTYVAISKHFMVKANGVRFHGTISDCNSVMKQLAYEVSKTFCFFALLVISPHCCLLFFRSFFIF